MKTTLERYDSIFCDVDGTLLIWSGPHPGRVPRPGEAHHGEPPMVNTPLVESLRLWQEPGRYLAIWTRGGADKAREAAERCGLVADAYLLKPRLAIDNHPQGMHFDVAVV